MPRITVGVFHCGRQRKGGPAQASKAVARERAAAQIAEHFAALRAAGERPRNMVVLLGSMSHAEMYASALRAAGLESVIAGGSVFGSLPEPELVRALLAVAVNRQDEEALYRVLVSPLFALSDEVLLVLASRRDEAGEVRRQSFERGFFATDREEMEVALGLSSADARALALSRSQLRAFCRQAIEGAPAAALRELLTASGLLDRLRVQGASGLASAGNYHKACRMVDELWHGATGIAGVASAFADALALSKEAPGSLATVDADFVQIMTVHASKGLEFPHVAVAELKSGREGAEKLIVENVGAASLLTTSFVPCKAYKGTAEKYAKCAEKIEEDPIDYHAVLDDAEQAPVRLAALSLGDRRRVLEAYAADQALAEARRLLYVALTRASRSLFLGFVTEKSPEKRYGGAGILEDVFGALEWGCEGDLAVMRCDYGGSAPALVMCRSASLDGEVDVVSDDAKGVAGEADVSDTLAERRGDDLDASCSDAGRTLGNEARDEPSPMVDDMEASVPTSFAVPLREVLPRPVELPFSFSREGLYSYTSLSGVHPHSDAPAVEGEDGLLVSVGVGGLGGEHAAGTARADGESVPMSQNANGASLFSEGSFMPMSTRPDGAPAASAFAAESSGRESEPSAPALVEQGNATALGTAFHLLAQQAIERSANGALFCPSEAAVAAQVARQGLTSAQAARLRAALDRWLASSEAARFATLPHRGAEVPFTVSVGGFFLEGEIDGLADDGDGRALLIDYKTGGTPDETSGQLHEKHLLQASCYAYALMRSGYRSVDAHFLRIEHQSADDPRDPQIVPYHFDEADLPELEALIIKMQQEATRK